MSSHYSVRGLSNPFPQEVEQLEGWPEQIYPALIKLELEHPLLSVGSASSHSSFPTITPSICFGVQVSAEERLPPKHSHVLKMDKQPAPHPLLSVGVESSQLSPASQNPFPHTEGVAVIGEQI